MTIVSRTELESLELQVQIHARLLDEESREA